jgi:MoaA/NifB/PqqE/SkfB family radical SAM enzyme
MGEPLLYPHFDLLLELCEELGLSINLTTNGTFPVTDNHQNVECWANRIVPLASDVKISWNGASETVQREIMRGTTLEQHVDHARRFISVRDAFSNQNYCSMTLQLTFMRINLEEIPDIVRLAIELGFDRVKGHHLWTHFPEMMSQSLRSDAVVAEEWNHTVEECRNIVKQHYVATNKTVRLDNFFELDLNNLSDIAPGGECPFLNREIWVDPSGRFNVCCAPDQQRKTLGDFGNLSKMSLADIIRSSKYSDLVENYQRKELCKICNMRRPS